MRFTRRQFSLSVATSLAGLFSACRLRSDSNQFVEGPVTQEYLAQDRDIQELLEKSLNGPLQRMLAKRQLASDTDSSAVVLENSTGNVLAYVGAIQAQSNYDNARRLVRSCGSLAKPFFYACALEAGSVSPDETIVDEPTCFQCDTCKGGVYCPDNYGGIYAHSAIPLRDALALSRNIPAIKVYRRLSRNQFDDLVGKLGLPKPSNYTTAPLGWEVAPIWMASAYTVFSNGGYAVEPRFITHRVVGEQKTETPIKRRPIVFSPNVCDWSIAAMRLCLTHGTGRAASHLANCLAGKTGSSDSAWAVLFSQRVTTVCWIGRRDSNIDTRTTGGKLAMPVLASFFDELRRARPDLTPQWRYA